MADGNSNETNRFAVPYNEHLPDELDQPSTPAEKQSSVRRHPSTGSVPKKTNEISRPVKNTGK